MLFFWVLLIMWSGYNMFHENETGKKINFPNEGAAIFISYNLINKANVLQICRRR